MSETLSCTLDIDVSFFSIMDLTTGNWSLETYSEKYGDETPLKPDGKEHAKVGLTETEHVLDVGDLIYTVKFAINTPELEAQYLVERGRFIAANKPLAVPKTVTSGMPMEGDLRLGPIIYRNRISASPNALV